MAVGQNGVEIGSAGELPKGLQLRCRDRFPAAESIEGQASQLPHFGHVGGLLGHPAHFPPCLAVVLLLISRLRLLQPPTEPGRHLTANRFFQFLGFGRQTTIGQRERAFDLADDLLGGLLGPIAQGCPDGRLL